MNNWKHGYCGHAKQFIIMKMHFNPVFWSLVEAGEVIMLCLQFLSTLCPEGAEMPEEELWGKISGSTELPVIAESN